MGVCGGAGRDGAAWLFSTSDNHYLDGPRKPVALAVAAGGKRYVHTPCLVRDGAGFRDLGSDRGLTEGGLAWTRSWVAPRDEPAPGGLNGKEWFEALAARSDCVDDALAFLAETPRGPGAQGNFLFADAGGNLACVEAGFRKAEVVLRAGPGQAASAARVNRFESAAMQGLDDSAARNPVYYDTSAARSRRAAALLARPAPDGLGLAEGMAILADTGGFSPGDPGIHGSSICSLGREHGTVSAEIAAPHLRAFWYTYGWTAPALPVGAPLDRCGDNVNSWRRWLCFEPSRMEEPGLYTTWEGMLTPLGIRYLAR